MKLRLLLTQMALAGLALTLAYQVTLAYNLDTRGLMLAGLHGEEHDKERVYHWTEGRATIGLIGVGRRAHRLTLTLNGSRPPGMDLPSVQLWANAQPIAMFRPTRATKDYTFEIPAEAVSAWGDLNLVIDADTFTPQNDLRMLGVILYTFQLEATPNTPTLPAALPLLCVALTLMFMQRMLERLRLPTAVTISLCAFLWFAVSIGLATERLWTAAALPWLVLISSVGYVLISSSSSSSSSVRWLLTDDQRPMTNDQ